MGPTFERGAPGTISAVDVYSIYGHLGDKENETKAQDIGVLISRQVNFTHTITLHNCSNTNKHGSSSSSKS